MMVFAGQLKVNSFSVAHNKLLGMLRLHVLGKNTPHIRNLLHQKYSQTAT